MIVENDLFLLINRFKIFVDLWEKVCDRCLFYYECENCNKWFKIYSDWEEF